MPDRQALGPLAGLRVLELADEKAHYCGKLLADMGADVIKIEPPGGDAARRVGPFVDDVPHPDRSLYFWHYNTNKRAVTLNLDTADGRDLFLRLLPSADIVLESLPPGYLPDGGLGYSELSGRNPRLIMCSLTPFGQNGPYRDFLTSDLVSLAMGGPLATCGYDVPPGLPPMHPDGYHAYQTGSHFAFFGLLTALYWRDATGQGQYIDASIHEACSVTTEASFPNYVYHGKINIRQTGRHSAMRPTRPWQFECADGVYVNLVGGIPRGPAAWRNLLEWMESKDMIGDLRNERYREVFWKRVLRADDPDAAYVSNQLIAFFKSMPAEEVYRGGQQRGMAIGIVRSPDEALSDPHFTEDRGFFTNLHHDDIDRTVTYPGHPYLFSKTPWSLRQRAPHVGEHNVAVYCDELALDREQLTALAECGVI